MSGGGGGSWRADTVAQQMEGLLFLQNCLIVIFLFQMHPRCCSDSEYCPE